jgi:Flp pilus assembly protein TadG
MYFRSLSHHDRSEQQKGWCPLYLTASGASFVEFVIVLPVFLMILFAFVDLSRYLMTESMLETAANRAIVLASTIPGLDDDPGTPDSRKDQAVSDVEAFAERLATSGFISGVDSPSMAYLTSAPKLELPVVLPGKSMREALETTPMKVTLGAKLLPIFPLIPLIDLKAEAYGFRETRSGVALPIPVDCQGNPIGDSNYYSFCDECNWPENYLLGNVYWDQQSRSCKQCSTSRYEARFTNWSKTGCRCPGWSDCTRELGPNGVLFVPVTTNGCVWCNCYGEFGFQFGADGKCECRWPQAVVRPLRHTGFASWGTLTGCYCEGADQITDQNCADRFPGLSVYADGTNCYCRCSMANCPNGYSVTTPEAGCSCTCPSGKVYDRSVPGCVCTNLNVPCSSPSFQRDPADCQCKCTITCGSGANNAAKKNESTCTCSCDGYGSPNAQGQCPDYDPNNPGDGGLGQ